MINHIIIPMLCISMGFGNMVPVYAAITENDASTFGETENNSISKETEVLYQKSASYFVTIPKTISLGSDKQSQYAVKVEGDIPSDKQVYVSPIDGISDTDAFDFYMHDQNTKAPKADVAATVTQSKFYWNFEDVQNAYEETDNNVTAEALTSGTWKGTFDFEINMHSMESDRLVLTTDGDVTMGAASTYQTNAYINGKEVNDAVEWASDNENIQAAGGLLETKASAQVGDTAKITVTAENFPSAYLLENEAETDILSADFNVTVIDIAFIKEETGETVSSLNIQPGGSGNIKASIIPDSVEGTVKWSTTAAAGLNLVPNGNTVTIKAAEDMLSGRTYDVIATCGTYSKILTVNIISDHEHNYVSEVTKEATYTEAGEKTITCTICNESHKEEIPMLKDSTAPTGSVTVSDNVWKNFLNSITFDIFFRETQNVVIEADDNESGVKEVSYYLAAEQVEEDNLSSLEWTTYNGKLTISPNEQYVIYVKIMDNQDNVTYINSDGIVLDNIAPTIEGAEDGGTYEPDKTITIGDGETLKVNGEKAEVINNSYTFEEEGEYTISASDKAGNETTITITIQHKHNYVDNICTECGERDPESINYVTLRSAGTATDTQRSSIFMGNSLMTREEVERINFLESSGGHTLSDDNCWDVSEAQDGSVLAWFIMRQPTASIYKYYTIYIAPKNDGDIIRMPQNSSRCFSNLGRESGGAEITGLDTIDFSHAADLSYLFYGTHIGNIIFDADTASVENMDYMFANCNYHSSNQQGYMTKYGPTSIEFSDRVKTPNLKSAKCMFSGDYYVESITNFSLPVIDDSMFFNTALQSIKIPDTITSIGKNAFESCDALARLVIPDSVETIGDNAFYNVPLVVLPCKFDGSTFGAKSVRINHNYAEEIIKESTCTENGEIKYTCSGCGYSYTKKTNMLAHRYQSSVIKEASCTETGEKIYTCSDCGDSYTRVTAMLEHNYLNDICTGCGRKVLYQMAPEGEQDKYVYTLYNHTIKLTGFKGDDEEVIVYANYLIDGEIYKTDVSTLSFQFKSSIKTIKFSNEIDTKNRTSMADMFYYCKSLTSVEGLENFDTSNVTDMSNMFQDCTALENVDLSGFDTSKVTNMNNMFRNCSSLTVLDLSSFDTGRVEKMSYMFGGCKALSSIYVGDKWTTSGAGTTTKWMFSGCGVSEVTYK